MKKLLAIAAFAALFAVSCTKVQVNTYGGRNEISFQTVSSLTKIGIDGTVSPTTETFGAYAWAAGTVGAYFMDNEQVSFNASTSEWKPSTTYYWPKNATVDFLCYYPYGMSGIAITPSTINYTGIDVEAGQTDIMYADKAVGYTDNVDEVNDGINGYTGVPTVFHHALAKVRVIVELAYNHKQEADGTVTDWTVNVNSASLSGFYKAGKCALTLASSPATGIVGWDKPADADGNFVWTPDGTTTSQNGTFSGAITPGNQYEAISEFFVLPQTLAAGQQKINLGLTVATTRNGAPFLNETFTTSADLYLATLPAWQINNVITYKIIIAPTASAGNGGNPGQPVDPNDPDLSDAVITFDPAVNGWDNIGVETVINI